ncbi:MAG: aminopeptidase [Herbinix sp.]|nr:aminopeptidase [Herbinix sp.]
MVIYMKYKLFYKEENELIRERYELAMERITLMEQENTVRECYIPYFHKIAAFVRIVNNVAEVVQENRLTELTLKELEALNMALYEDIAGDNYETSYANPAYACVMLGEKSGKLLCFLATELRSIIIYAYESRLYELTIYLELLIEIYNYFEEEDDFTYNDVKRAVYDFMSDNCDVFMNANIREMLDPGLSFAGDIILESDLSDLRYLYQFGEYITENEIKTAQFLNTLPEEQLKAMADTYTEGYRLGFLANRLDLSKKGIVNIRYQLGFERMVYYAIQNFKEMGLKPTIYRAAYTAINKRQHLKIGYHATSPNRQYDYDHRYDIALFLDKAFKERKLDCLKNALEEYKHTGSLYAGPALIEVFGEELFAPEEKKEAAKLDKRQQKLYVDYYKQDNMIKYNYLKLEETSFTIISYPVPEIGKDFEKIFAETVKVNTLDSGLYQDIQQKIIDALDQGDYVRILGAGNNHTDMTVKLYPLVDASKETIFENCVADVNIPVGEVFTTPVLKGTKGILHIPKIYLHDLEYRELELNFEDGRIISYHCANFSEEERNKSYIKDNLFFNQDNLPLGEFAIGTNTTAYSMAKKFDIASRLPILIAEKTGPHFAIGDTCYKMSEDIKVYNPDQKEIIARDNEISILRKTEPEKAYFNCHTDITLPYDEIKEIVVYKKDGTSIPIIQNARFVLDGTTILNEAFGE